MRSSLPYTKRAGELRSVDLLSVVTRISTFWRLDFFITATHSTEACLLICLFVRLFTQIKIINDSVQELGFEKSTEWLVEFAAKAIFSNFCCMQSSVEVFIVILVKMLSNKM